MWISVIISFFTSLIVSILTFIFGFRAGKNQVDRPRLKDIYRELSVHFEELYNKLLIGNPKRWKDFPENKNDRAYLPIVKKLKKEGNLIDLNKTLSEEIENLELKYLSFSFNFFSNLQTLLSESTNLLKKYSKNVTVETENKISSGNAEKGSSYLEKNFGSILIKEELHKICSMLGNDSSLGICLFFETNFKRYELCIYANSLTDLKLSDFLLILQNDLLKLPDVINLMERREKIILEINKILPILKNRAIDPHPFWETLKASISDIFKKY